MFWNKRPDPSPLGVPLGELEALLAPTSIKTTRKDNALLARHEHYTLRIEVVPPEARESENGPIRAVVRIIAELPKPLLALFQGGVPETTAAFNAFAALGALYSDRDVVHIGSRLTIYEVEDSWQSLHLPLLLFTTICGTEAILGGIRRAMAGDDPNSGSSAWTEDDFEQAQSFLSPLCLCTTGGLGLTAEFGLAADAISAAAGDHQTALFQLLADQPHPELGGGLFCLLQMPHQVSDPARLQKICLQLNSMEMAAHDLPPHFGAWCPGTLGNNPSYISFLPNPLHEASGIAVNMSFWAINRAQWANAMLASLGAGAI
jgi:hypothetical protein